MSARTLATKVVKRIRAEYRLMCWDINVKFRKSVTVSTKQGLFTVLSADSIISKSLYCDGKYELDLMVKTLKFLRSIGKCPPKGEGTIVDIGANNGVISIGALYNMELDKAIAIEPDPENFSLLQRNVNQNGLMDRVTCLPYAISNQRGEVLFELSDNNYGDHRVRISSDSAHSDIELFHESDRNVITIQSDTLDDLLSKLPDVATQSIALIWIDVQGHEGYAFMGAKSIFKKGIPVMSEIWPYGIKRAGMTQKQFCEIAADIWSHYWVLRKERFVKYPIALLDIYFDELGDDGDGENVIFI